MIQFYGRDGEILTVSAANPLPVNGGVEDAVQVLATSPLSATDNENGTVTVALTGTVAAASVGALPISKTTGLQAALDDLDRVAANVGDADDADLASVAAAVDAIRDALVTAGLMEAGA